MTARKPRRASNAAAFARGVGFALACAVFGPGAWGQTPSAEFVAQCEARLAPARLEVVVPRSAVVYDFSRSVAQLDQTRPALSPGHHTLGLTVAQLQSSLKWQSNTLVLSDGRACMRPSVLITLDVGPQRVYVANQFPRGTCAFDDIARHELRHVMANQQRAEEVGDALRAALERQMGQSIYYGVASTLQTQLDQALRTSWFPWAQAQLNAVERVHASIDSPAEYARNATACNGEIARLLTRP